MTVSMLTGRRQGPWLRATARLLAVLALAGTILPGAGGTVAARLAIVVVTATPLLRVGWVIYRLHQEHDRRYVRVGVALLSAVALGVLVSWFVGA